MKWREPWAVSLKEQPRFNLFGRDVLKSALSWSAAFAGVGIVAGSKQDFSVQLERASHVLWIAPTFGVLLAVFLYVGGWLSPKKIGSGPRGIVVEKGATIALIPWQNIERYGFVRYDGLDVLRITAKNGDSVALFLSEKVHPSDVERELVEKTGKHPDTP